MEPCNEDCKVECQNAKCNGISSPIKQCTQWNGTSKFGWMTMKAVVVDFIFCCVGIFVRGYMCNCYVHKTWMCIC